ncbi:MAG: cupin domain-containing protein [Candidatus Pacebacteria bacterium CG10_big_fil_rev_8_21_14_0_10_36_11]|nr:cupin domain-containing protein [Candidatus Pacearchaeota archaeon]OIP74032.1 MAG: cupin [Candidatus Pacebacteria bacterium CG2_30_36_39]PIR64326.1 MAG: cupin domain-containing protein [Candidatus Pacebacteria bacterium CG10_big_fil_rev_8_21_14_0_10_36_11]PJC42547.1 MAG: cupin domain-containing protein [Candidatus Pacebacteria bacterium CG_4_9_14_0_2_um_filter_36_8]
MTGFHAPIENITLENNFFRKVLFTAKNMQLVAMALQPNEDIGMEVHEDNDQFFRFEAGSGKVIIDGQEFTVKDGDAVIVPAGAQHNIINTSSSEMLRLYTIYAPAHHADGTIHTTKAEAMAAEHD